MNQVKYTQCGHMGLEPGFVEDAGEHSCGCARWMAGPLERGMFGGAKRLGRPRWQIEAYRCPNCSHVELFAPQQVRRSRGGLSSARRRVSAAGGDTCRGRGPVGGRPSELMPRRLGPQ